jgi:hypothetical protein
MIQNYIIDPSKKFTLKELKANREGKLTPEQQEEIHSLLKKGQQFIKIFSKLWYPLYFITCGAVYVLNPSIKFSNNLSIWLCVLIFPLIIPLLIKSLLSKQVQNPTVEPVLVIKDFVKKTHTVSDGEDTYIIQLGKASFYVSRYIYNLIEDDNNLYTFYYVQSSYKMILCWEKL